MMRKMKDNIMNSYRIICLFSICWLLFFTASQAQLNTWVQQTSGTGSWLHGVHFANASNGWVVGDGGTILKSTNTGVHWSPQFSGTTRTLTDVDFIDNNHGMVCGGKGLVGIILKTTNGGDQWLIVDSVANLVSIDFVTSNIAWAAGAGGILKSTNGGNTWTRQWLSDSTASFNSIRFYDETTGWITGLNAFFTPILYKTTDGGATWVQLTNGINYYDYIDAFYFLDSQHGWMSGYTVPDTIGYGMIKKTSDGGLSWTNIPLSTDQELYSIGFTSLTEGWACGSSGILLHSTDGGTTWFDEGATTTSLDKVYIRPGEGGWIVGLDGTILRNNFGGLTQQVTVAMNTGWNMISLPLNLLDRFKPAVFPTALSSAFRYVSSQGYLNDDTLDVGTGYWVKFSNAQDVSFSGAQIDSITLQLTSGWNLVGGISVPVPVSMIIQQPSNLITNVYQYTPTGYSADTVLKSGKAYWIKVIQNCTITLTSGQGGNVSALALSDISGLRNNELPPPPPAEILADDDIQAAKLPAEYRLGQNYPNPFNPVTRIQFDLPEQSTVTVTIYNALGQTMMQLFDGVVDAGTQSILWNTETESNTFVGSGIYFYRLIAVSTTSGRSFTALKKMVLLK